MPRGRPRKPKPKKLEYKILGAYDSETTNTSVAGKTLAFPVLHTLGLIKSGVSVSDLDAQNCENLIEIRMYRHAQELYEKLDEIVSTDYGFIPVIVAHNLGFDMYSLSIWLNRCENVKVLAKSARKPITFTVCDAMGSPRLVFWDTAIFAPKRLEQLGVECGYSKGDEWDYDLVRTPHTPLTDLEINYAKSDIYVILVWLAWWLERNPEISENMLGKNVVTKTGIVRARRKHRFQNLKGENLGRSVGNLWLYRNRCEKPKSDDELFTLLACTRGGFTFIANKSASVVYDQTNTDLCIAGFDASSQHPAQICTKFYPVGFSKAEPEALDLAFDVIKNTSFEALFERFHRPFPVAFYACFEFTNLRPKPGTVFEKFGIFPLADARSKAFYDEDNGDKKNWEEFLEKNKYSDSCFEPVCAFGKIISAKKARLFITELTAFEICAAYEFDQARAISGYSTCKFAKPADMDLLSVMNFFKLKYKFKEAKEIYEKNGFIDQSLASELVSLGLPENFMAKMVSGSAERADIDHYYQNIKADLNAIFGISCSNEYRRNTVLSQDGIAYEGNFGICNAPKNCKVWYQFGARVVGWSRIAQILVMTLCADFAEQIINGDTDSVKFLVKKENIDKIKQKLSKHAHSVDQAKELICARIRAHYPQFYDELVGIGHYELEFEVERFCASWNKAYCVQKSVKGGYAFDFTIAGVPSVARGDHMCVNLLADHLYAQGMSFAKICDLFLGYNTTYAADVLRLKGRFAPQWGEMFFETVTDYEGVEHLVAEPRAMALKPMTKLINSLAVRANRQNYEIAKRNRESVNAEPVLITAIGPVFADLQLEPVRS